MSHQLLFALALAKKKEVDVSAHLDIATQLLWVALILLVVFFVLRPELWRRLWFQRIDARGPALARICLAITAVWTFVDLLVLQGEWLFTDQGLLLTDMARKNNGGKLRTLWDPEHGFEHWWDVFLVLTDRWSVLFIRSDPPFVYTIFGLLFFFGFLMTIGLWTRVASVMTWLLALQLYNYNSIYYTGGDTVMRVMLFTGIFIDWGQAYSVDAWRRRRKAILGGAAQFPAPKRIAAWPVRLMMLQLACIYCATGLLKSGPTWANGSALYYALNLDHFYRWPMHLTYAWAHELYITRVMTVLVHWWEICFPLVFVGEILRGYDSDKKAGIWQGPVPRWTLYCLGFVGSVLAVWTAPSWAKTAPLFLLALLIFVDRRYLGEPDTSGRSPEAWAIRVLSWLCLVGFVVIGAYFANLGVHYYFTPPPNAAGWLQDKELLRKLAAVATIAVPLLLTAVILLLRRFTPRAYRFVRDWLLGKRLWLTIGFLMHVGIDLTMNVGTFVQVMIAVYPVWLAGDDVEAWWRFLLWRAAKPGEAGRPALPKSGVHRLGRLLIAPLERVNHRVRRPPWTVVHGPDEAAIRRAALLRCWDLGERLNYELDAEAGHPRLRLRSPDGKVELEGSRAARELISLFPGLWWLWPIGMFPGIGRLAAAILRQRI
ncbi:MAG TPA: HTTM domain-containing protein [Enhygromyxa sp.]|nr:HTTM domain-containing protein [Enhygromyxa sp.]